MLSGWDAQQRSRMLNETTIAGREWLVRRFAEFTNEYPWRWRAQDVEDFTTSLRASGAAHSTIRGYHRILALFVGFVCDPRYGWVEECEQRFGQGPALICHEWNTAAHVSEFEGRPGRRALTAEELQRFFDYADDQVEHVAATGRKGTLAAFRDATLFKVAYAWGLRRRELVMLDIADLHRNAQAPQFGSSALCTCAMGRRRAAVRPSAALCSRCMGGRWTRCASTSSRSATSSSRAATRRCG